MTLGTEKSRLGAWWVAASGLLSLLGGCSSMAWDQALPDDGWDDFDAGVYDAGEPWGDDDYSDGTDPECLDDAGPDCVGSKEPFECSDGRLVEAQYVCDDFWDCDLGEDETVVACMGLPEDEIYVCANGDELPASVECDLYPDCTMGEDEAVCDGGFVCTSGWDLPDEWVCDIVSDCPDGEDELGCEEQLDGGTDGDAGVDGGVDGGYVEITLIDGYAPAR